MSQIKDLEKLYILTDAEEQLYLGIIQQGKRHRGYRIAFKAMELGSLRLLASVAQKVSRHFSRSPMDFNDLFQEGYFGLCRAIEKFNPNSGNKFSTYAYECMTNAMLDALRSKRYRSYVSLESFIVDGSHEGNDDLFLIDTVHDPTQTAESQLLRQELRTELTRVLGTLDPDHERLLRLKYGEDKLTPQEIAERLALDLSTKQLSSKTQNAKRALKSRIEVNSPELREYLDLF